MLPNPYVAARLVRERQSEMEAVARRRRLGRQVAAVPRAPRDRAPSRVPRHWRWRYL
jgi:hypothetical protein